MPSLAPSFHPPNVPSAVTLNLQTDAAQSICCAQWLESQITITAALVHHSLELIVNIKVDTKCYPQEVLCQWLIKYSTIFDLNYVLTICEEIRKTVTIISKKLAQNFNSTHQNSIMEYVFNVIAQTALKNLIHRYLNKGWVVMKFQLF